jgi:hypothetical protein
LKCNVVIRGGSKVLGGSEILEDLRGGDIVFDDNVVVVVIDVVVELGDGDNEEA